MGLCLEEACKLVLKFTFNRYGLIPRSLLRNGDPKSSGLSFPHVFSGNPGEPLTGPPIKTFGGECAREGATLAR